MFCIKLSLYNFLIPPVSFNFFPSISLNSSVSSCKTARYLSFTTLIIMKTENKTKISARYPRRHS